MKKFTEECIQDLLESAIDYEINELMAHDIVDNFKIKTFDDAGVLTDDKGIVLKINGQEFQITIVRSK